VALDVDFGQPLAGADQETEDVGVGRHIAEAQKSFLLPDAAPKRPSSKVAPSSGAVAVEEPGFSRRQAVACLSFS
jgi:hypothetical protein